MLRGGIVIAPSSSLPHPETSIEYLAAPEEYSKAFTETRGGTTVYKREMDRFQQVLLMCVDVCARLEAPP